MNEILKYLDKIDPSYDEMVNQLERWVNINSHTFNMEGLENMLSVLQKSFQSLSGIASVKNGCLSIVKRTESPYKIFLGGHYDTVYPKESPFQKAFRKDDEIMIGPGVTDMKGGLIVMLKALEVFEMSPFSKNIGWEILINPDEEIGSPQSAPLFEECAKRNAIGLLFEPASPSGNLVSSRKGSANYVIAVNGISAHAGRDFHHGKSAIYAISSLVTHIEQLNSGETTVNVGKIEGGIGNNIVPDHAHCSLNVRFPTDEDFLQFERKFNESIAAISKREGISVDVKKGTKRPPKILTKETERLFSDIKSCAKVLNMDLEWYPTGGVCDGNILAHAGLPTVDTMGVVGGKIHTHEEYIFLPSLKERSKLTALLLMKLGAAWNK